MVSRFLRLGFPLIAFLVIASCRQAPIYNVQTASFVNPAANVALEERGHQIKRAGAALGWQMIDESPGIIRATLSLRSHRAVAEIRYDQTQFSIRYVDSVNLNYDGSNIHPNYNGWIQRLEQTIVAQSSV